MRWSANGRPHFVNTWFQVLLTPLQGYFFTFPSRYLFTIGHWLVFRLGEWAPRIQTAFHVCRPTWDTPGFTLVFENGAITLYGWKFQIIILTSMIPYRCPATPTSKLIGLACSAFARHYLRNLCWFLFLQVLRCFTSLSVAFESYGFTFK